MVTTCLFCFCFKLKCSVICCLCGTQQQAQPPTTGTASVCNRCEAAEFCNKTSETNSYTDGLDSGGKRTRQRLQEESDAVPLFVLLPFNSLFFPQLIIIELPAIAHLLYRQPSSQKKANLHTS